MGQGAALRSERGVQDAGGTVTSIAASAAGNPANGVDEGGALRGGEPWPQPDRQGIGSHPTVPRANYRRSIPIRWLHAVPLRDVACSGLRGTRLQPAKKKKPRFYAAFSGVSGMA